MHMFVTRMTMGRTVVLANIIFVATVLGCSTWFSSNRPRNGQPTPCLLYSRETRPEELSAYGGELTCLAELMTRYKSRLRLTHSPVRAL